MTLWKYFVPVAGSFAFYSSMEDLFCVFFLSVTSLATRDDVSSANTFGIMGYYGVLKQLLPRLRKLQGSLILLEHRRGATWNFA